MQMYKVRKSGFENLNLTGDIEGRSIKKLVWQVREKERYVQQKHKWLILNEHIFKRIIERNLWRAIITQVQKGMSHRDNML